MLHLYNWCKSPFLRMTTWHCSACIYDAASMPSYRLRFTPWIIPRTFQMYVCLSRSSSLCIIGLFLELFVSTNEIQEFKGKRRILAVLYMQYFFRLTFRRHHDHRVQVTITSHSWATVDVPTYCSSCFCLHFKKIGQLHDGVFAVRNVEDTGREGSFASFSPFYDTLAYFLSFRILSLLPNVHAFPLPSYALVYIHYDLDHMDFLGSVWRLTSVVVQENSAGAQRSSLNWRQMIPLWFSM
jgi:hypothetical protein